MFCPQCGDDIDDTMNFCTSCGAALNAGENTFGRQQVRGNRRGQQVGASGAMTKTRRFDSLEDDLDDVVSDMEDWLRSNNYETQRLKTEDDKTLVQAKRPGEWRKIVGMDTAANITFHQGQKNLTVEIGEGQWLTKAPWALVGAVINPLFAIPAGIGAWEQWRLPDYVFEYLSDRVGG